MNDVSLIDRVARGMTEGSLPGDFRARVLARLPPAGRVSWWRITVPAGTVAALGVVWVMAGTMRPTGPTGMTGATATTATTATTAATDATDAVAQPVTVTAAAPSSGVASAAPAESGPAALEPLPAPPPIVVDPIQPLPPSIAPITVDPIVWDRFR